MDKDSLSFFEACSARDPETAHALIHSVLASGRPTPASSSKGAFSAEPCFRELIHASDGWSLRDLNKFIGSLRSEVLGTESCVLSTFMWSRELKRQLKDIANLTARSAPIGQNKRRNAY